jgi:hypothetical protein
MEVIVKALEDILIETFGKKNSIVQEIISIASAGNVQEGFDRAIFTKCVPFKDALYILQLLIRLSGHRFDYTVLFSTYNLYNFNQSVDEFIIAHTLLPEIRYTGQYSSLKELIDSSVLDGDHAFLLFIILDSRGEIENYTEMFNYIITSYGEDQEPADEYESASDAVSDFYDDLTDYAISMMEIPPKNKELNLIDCKSWGDVYFTLISTRLVTLENAAKMLASFMKERFSYSELSFGIAVDLIIKNFLPSVYSNFNFNVNISEFLIEHRIIKEIAAPSHLTFENAIISRIISMETALLAMIIIIYQTDYPNTGETTIEDDYLDKLDIIRYNYRYGYDGLGVYVPEESDCMSRGSTES